MAARSRQAKKVRTEGEFNVATIRSALNVPTGASSVYAWSLPDIYDARDMQMRGAFSRPAQLAAAMRTDDAIAVARANRLAPQRCIKVTMVPAKGARGRSIAAEAEALYGQDGIAVSPGTLADIEGCLVDHGVAFAVNVATVREDGSRVDMAVHYWPIEHVRWDHRERAYFTRVASGTADLRTTWRADEVRITHGDGRWIVFSTHDDEPFKQEAALLPASLVWARHAFAVRDWAKSSVAHGSAKVIGEMPEGVPLQKEGGGDSDEAAAFATLLRAIASSDQPVGIRPSGAKTDFLTNTSTAWQIFAELVSNAEKAAARIYLGTDGTLGSQGGAPGVDVQALFGVAITKVQGDLAAIERGLMTGSIEVWAALNFGDSSLAPSRRYMIPDADADAARASEAERRTAFQAAIKESRENGFVVDQAYVDALAASHGIDAPQLPPVTDAKAPTIALAPADLARVVTVNEARSSAGLGPLTLRDGAEDPDGFLTVEQFAAKKAAQSAAAAPSPGGAPPAEAPPTPALRAVP